MAKKTAKKAAKKKTGKGKRYSDAERQKVISFVNKVNAAKGRGGVAQASRKFGISQLSIGNWLKKSGASGGARPGRPRSAGRKGRDRVLSDLTSLNREISKRRSELAALEARFDKLKASL